MGASDVRWELAEGRILGPKPFLVAGIVNITPDSFSDGGRYQRTDAALAHARALAAEGADILDIGGESTRPGAADVPASEEAARVLPVVAALLADRGQSQADGAPAISPAISVDTVKAPVAAAVLEAGAEIINDVSGCAFDPAMVDVLGQYRPGYVLTHSQGRPQDMQDNPRYDDVLAEVLAFFEERLRQLTAAGLPEERVVLDPGIGFGKTLEHNLTLLRGLGRFSSLGRPVYVGLSRKSFLGQLLGLPVQQRTTATQVATSLAALAGAGIHRVHDVALTIQTLALTRAALPAAAIIHAAA